MDINDLTAEQAEKILELTGVDVMAPPSECSYARRYAALACYRRREAGELVSLEAVMKQPLRQTVAQMGGDGLDPTPEPRKTAAKARPKRAR